MDLANKKKEIIKWINSVENPFIIEQIDQIKERKTFDFEKEWMEGISISDARKKTTNFIKSLTWKSQS